ncbi:3-carboxy-cis,cis-muconate cycloisomerase [Streptomyces sp. NPDC050617]|uniref:3-carboxy-cis,cis-muconate cycloisomerase n=1 Tax=Streptomyces sp. NPDC050617 TaxID=3154628 RepID=UPI0034275A2E
MSSADDSAAAASPDAGLLAPVWAGCAAEAATGDTAYLAALLDAEAALVRAQAAVGQAPRAAADAVTAAARADAFDVRDLALRARAGGNPVIPLVADLTGAVARTDPEAAGYVHRGATSQDILDTALMLVAARTLPHITGELARTAEALRRLAAVHRTTPMPGRTLTQHAVPTTFGLKAAGWRSLALDAHDRLAAVRARLPAQLGGAAGTLAAFETSEVFEAFETFGTSGADEDQESGGGVLRLLGRFAVETGLAEPELPWHTLRTPVADLAGALAFCAGALGKIAADVLVLSRTEIGEVAEGSGGGSSAMPHKSNPVRAALIAASARQAPGLAGVLVGALAAEDERPAGAWHAEWQPLRELLRIAGGAARQAAELTEGLSVFPERMRENLDAAGGLMASERIAAALTPPLGRARAKDLLTAAARRAAAERLPLAEALTAALATEVPGVLEKVSEDRIRRLADPAGYLGRAPELTDRALRRQPRTDL